MATHHRLKVFLAFCLFTVLICSTASAVSVCNNTCVDLMTDDNNCGTCGNVCNSAYCWSCINGICSTTQERQLCCGVLCAPGYGCCGGRCVDLTSRDNCGACGKKCSLGQYCRNGWCRSRLIYTPGNIFEKSTGIKDLHLCTAGETGCNNRCVDLMSDPDNCGTCGNVCDKSIVGRMCINGICKVDCNVGIDCNNNRADGCEKPLFGDPCNCRGASCYWSERNVFLSCQNRGVELGLGCLFDLACNYELIPWDVDCSMTTGQQHVNIYSDVNNCGACGFKCNAGQICDHLACKTA